MLSRTRKRPRSTRSNAGRLVRLLAVERERGIGKVLPYGIPFSVVERWERAGRGGKEEQGEACIHKTPAGGGL